MTGPRILILDSPIIPGSRIVPDRDRVHHLRDVLRVRLGHVVFVSDGEGRRWISHVVEEGGGFALLVEGLAPEAPISPRVKVGLLIAALKSGRTEWAIEKAVECGVREVRVFVADRSVARTGEDSAKADRFGRVAAEAARQCGRDDVPGVSVWQSLDRALAGIEGDGRFVLDERPGAAPLSAALGAYEAVDAVWLAIGPEGSFTDRERAILQAAGFAAANLGPRVLRAETAAIAAVIIAQSLIGDMGGMA